MRKYKVYYHPEWDQIIAMKRRGRSIDILTDDWVPEYLCLNDWVCLGEL